MSLAFAQHLEDFGRPNAIPQLPDPLSSPSQPILTTLPDPAELEREKEVAFQEGYAAARAEFEAEKQTELEALRQDHSAEMSKLEQNLVETIAVQLKTDLTREVREFAENTQFEVGQILKQIIDDEIVNRSLSELAAAIETVCLEDPQIEIKMTGPDSLLNPMKDRLGEQFSKLAFIEHPGTELSIAFDQTMMTTQLEQWRQKLELDGNG